MLSCKPWSRDAVGQSILTNAFTFVNGEWKSLSFSFHDTLLLLVITISLRLTLLPHGLPGNL